MQVDSFDIDLLEISILQSIEMLEKDPNRNSPVGDIKKNFDNAIAARHALINKVKG